MTWELDDDSDSDEDERITRCEESNRSRLSVGDQGALSISFFHDRPQRQHVTPVCIKTETTVRRTGYMKRVLITTVVHNIPWTCISGFRSSCPFFPHRGSKRSISAVSPNPYLCHRCPNDIDLNIRIKCAPRPHMVSAWIGRSLAILVASGQSRRQRHSFIVRRILCRISILILARRSFVQEVDYSLISISSLRSSLLKGTFISLKMQKTRLDAIPQRSNPLT